MNNLLFDVPWWIPAVLGIAGVWMLLSGNRRQQIRQRNAGAGILLLAIVWVSLSFFVDTDKEKVERASRQIVQNAVDGKWDAFRAAMLTTADLSLREVSMMHSAETISAFAASQCERIKLRSAHMQNVRVEQTGTYITVSCDIVSTQESLAPIETSSWQFEWEQTTQGWRLKRMRLMALKDVPLDQVGHQLVK